MTPLLVGVLVLVAALVAAPDPNRRLRRLATPSHGTPRGRARASWFRRRWATAVQRRRGRGSAGDDAARTVAELAALLRAGLPSHHVWSYLPRPSRPLDGSGAGWTFGRAGESAPQGGRHEPGWDGLLREAERASREGRSVAAALRGAAPTCAPRVEEVAMSLAAAWEVTERTGAPAAAVLDRLADALRAEADARGARAAAIAGPRATARVLAWLPVLGLALGQMVGADPLHVLLETSLGRACAVTGTVLALGAALWTKRLVALAEAPP